MSTDSSKTGSLPPVATSRDVANESSREPDAYELRGLPHTPEDILFCLDIDRQMEADMKAAAAPKGSALTRLDAVKQAILLFIHSKSLMHPNHRFAFAKIGHTLAWHQQEFTNDLEIINNSVRTLTSDGLYIRCDLTQLFRWAAAEAKKTRANGRTLRVILIYCRSNVVPDYPTQWPDNQRIFTFDAIYLHDKPGQHNCPQEVYDALVEALERVSEHEGYIYESGAGLTRVLFKHICMLLSHPQQRCAQDDFDVPRDLSKAAAPVETSAGAVSTRKEEDSIAH